jgi:membrane associated rhomboid family serine protease
MNDTSTLFSPLAVREALLRALATSPDGRPRPGVHLLRDTADEAVLVRPELNMPIVLASVGDDAARSGQALLHHLDAWYARNEGAQMCVVLVGGDETLRAWLETQDVPLRTGGRVLLGHLSGAGRLWFHTPSDWPPPEVDAVQTAVRRLAEEVHGAGRLPPGLTPEERLALAPFEHAQPQLFNALAHAPTPAIWWILGVNVAMFALEWILSETIHSNVDVVWRLGACARGNVLDGEVWRLLSCAFLHYGPIHILANMSSLTAYRWMERLMGSARFLLLYVLAALGGSLSAVAFGRAGSEMAGASGAIFGIMGATVYFSFRGPLPDAVRASLRRRLGSVLGVNLLISLLPFVSLSAHAGGLVAGLVLGFTGLLNRDPSADTATASRWGRGITIAAGLATFAAAASIAAALVMGGASPPH